MLKRYNKALWSRRKQLVIPCGIVATGKSFHIQVVMSTNFDMHIFIIAIWSFHCMRKKIIWCRTKSPTHKYEWTISKLKQERWISLMRLLAACTGSTEMELLSQQPLLLKGNGVSLKGQEWWSHWLVIYRKKSEVMFISVGVDSAAIMCSCRAAALWTKEGSIRAHLLCWPTFDYTPPGGSLRPWGHKNVLLFSSGFLLWWSHGIWEWHQRQVTTNGEREGRYGRGFLHAGEWWCAFVYNKIGDQYPLKEHWAYHTSAHVK